MKLLLCTLVFSLFVFSCGNTNNVATPSDGGGELSQEHFNGVWEGSVSGGLPHFNGRPFVTLSLTQIDTVLNGEISTSDSAFVAVQIEQAVASDSTLCFEAVQTTIYAGARVKFTGKLDGNDITGTWNHGGLHDGQWFASK